MNSRKSVLQALSDLDWHSAAEVAGAVEVRQDMALRRLYDLLSKGIVVWKPHLSSRGNLKMMFKALDGSNLPKAKAYPPEPLGREVDDALRAAVDDRYYYSGIAARFLYGLIDRFANLNLVEVHVPRRRFREAVEKLIEKVSDAYIVVPDSMPWDLINRTMQIATVLRVIPHYRSGEKHVHHGRNVQSIGSLLREVKAHSPSEFRKVANMAIDQGRSKA